MKRNTRKLLAILAHPDDESLGMGGMLRKYAEEGVETYLLMATKGERGRFGTQKESPGMDIVGKTRAQELLDAAKVLKLKGVEFLGYTDGDLDKADSEEIIGKISLHIRKIKPDVIATFGPEGSYGHPDHIAISQFTTAAILKASDANFLTGNYDPHTVSKLYYIAWPVSKWDAYQSAFKELYSKVDGIKRFVAPYPEWAVTTRIDASKYWRQVWKAVTCHKTQMGIYKNLEKLTESQHIDLWGKQEFYRAFSLVNGGRKTESDLFEGL